MDSRDKEDDLGFDLSSCDDGAVHSSSNNQGTDASDRPHPGLQPLPPDEDVRVRTLHEYQILDTPPDERFDRITRLAANLVEAPIALINLIDTDRQWIKSCYGLQADEIPRADSFCTHTIAQGEAVMVVEDTLADPRFKDNPAVQNSEGPESIRFYAGVPLKARNSMNIGTLCVIDNRPRKLDDEKRKMLLDLAALVVDELELRREVRERQQIERMLLDQTYAMDLVAQYRPAYEVLTLLCQIVERHLPGVVSSFLVADSKKPEFSLSVAPSLPDEFRELFEHSPIGLDQGPSAAAAFLGQPVIITDFASTPAQLEAAVGLEDWQPAQYVRDFAAKHSVRACWSIPFFAITGQVLGTLAIYHTDPVPPGEHERSVIERISHIAGIAVQQDRAHRHLAESETQYRLLAIAVSRTDSGIVIIDEQGHVEWSNDGFMRMTGYRLDEIKEDHYGDLLSAMDADQAALQRIADAVECKTSFTEELRICHKDSTPFWIFIQGQPLLEDDGQVNSFLLIHSDVTERKVAERAKQRSAERIAILHDIGRAILHKPSMQEIASTTLSRLSLLLSFTRANVMVVEQQEEDVVVAAAYPPGAGELYPGERVEFKRVSHLFDLAPDEVRYCRNIRAADEEGRWHHRAAMELGLRTIITMPLAVDRRIVGFLNIGSVRASAYDDEELRILQEVADMLALAIRQARYEEELIEAKEEAEEMNQLKSAFLANMSHEIRTPLATILGYSEVLAEKVDGPEADYVDMIRTASDRLMATLNSVLELAKIESRSIQLSPRVLNVNSLVEEIVALLQPQAQEHKLELTCATPRRPILLEVDQGALIRVLNNLLSNALKFTNEGSVTVSVSTERSAELDGEEVVAIQIADTGIGIDPGFLAQVFEDFQQESRGVRQGYEGVGLGLTITKHLVDLMEGTIDVRSEKGRGSTFTVRLPVRFTVIEDERQDEGPEYSGPVPNMDRKQILFVEDQVEVRSLLQLLLAETHRVDTAATYDEAIEMASREHFDCFLIDIHLGGTRNGIDLLADLRQMSNHIDTPAIACTAYALPGDRERFLDSGFNGYLSKPFAKKKLTDALETILRTRSSSSDPADTGTAL